MINVRHYFLISLAPFLLNADAPRPESFGNFALPTAMQPSPLFSFGQNTVDAHDALWYTNPIYFKAREKSNSFYNALYFLYGITDNFSIFALIPVPATNKVFGKRISGFGDVLIQGEYAFINTATATDQTQATLVGSIYLPTGVFEDANQGPDLPLHLPFTGNGATSFFLGGTYSYTTMAWYSFTSLGGLITTHHKTSKIGNSLLYQAGIGRNIVPLKDQVLLLLFELDGFYSKKDTILGLTDPNSGGNIIYFGPVLYYATKRLIFQAGVQVPVYQKLNGIQPKISYEVSISVAWLFNHDDYDR